MKKFLEKDITNLAVRLGKLANNFEGKTVLITGAAGFVGGYMLGLFQYLNKNVFTNPANVIAVDNYLTGTKNNPFYDQNDPHLTFLRHDATEPYELDTPVDYIIHAAGVASPVYYAKFPLETIGVAVDGLRNMLDLAKKNPVEGVLYFSSSEIYGDPHPEFIPTPEHYYGNVSSMGLRACYDESKRLGETIATVYEREHGVPVKIVRPFNVYGPGMKRDDYRALPNFLNAALDGKTLEVHNRGTQTRTFCYATDAIDGFLRVLLLGKPGEAYNIGSDDEEISMQELAERVVKVHGKPVDVSLADYPEGYPVGDPNRRRPDITKARTMLGYAPSTPLDEGLERMFEWYKLLRFADASNPSVEWSSVRMK